MLAAKISFIHSDIAKKNYGNLSLLRLTQLCTRWKKKYDIALHAHRQNILNNSEKLYQTKVDLIHAWHTFCAIVSLLKDMDEFHSTNSVSTQSNSEIK